jgi:hypothetical protein
MKLLVFCMVPGLHVAGMAHPKFAAHPIDTFTSEQLLTLMADSNIVVVIGEPLAADRLDALAVYGTAYPAPVEPAASVDGPLDMPDGVSDVPEVGGKPRRGART